MKDDSGGHDHREGAVRLYENAIRAIDMKAQIFLAFLTVTVSPLTARVVEAALPPLWRVGLAAAFAIAFLMFVAGVRPRNGGQGRARLFFNSRRSPDEIGAAVRDPGFRVDYAESVVALHAIYAVKSRFVKCGIVFLTVYALAVAAVLALA